MVYRCQYFLPDRKKTFLRMKLHYLVILFEQIFSLSSDAEGLLKKIKIILDQICNPKFCQKCAKSLRSYHNFQHRGTCLTVLSERSCCNSWNLYTFWRFKWKIKNNLRKNSEFRFLTTSPLIWFHDKFAFDFKLKNL